MVIGAPLVFPAQPTSPAADVALWPGLIIAVIFISMAAAARREQQAITTTSGNSLLMVHAAHAPVLLLPHMRCFKPAIQPYAPTTASASPITAPMHLQPGNGLLQADCPRQARIKILQQYAILIPAT